MKKIATLIFSIILLASYGQKNKLTPIKIKPEASFSFKVNEPSDIVFNPATNTLFVVSDNGYLAEADLEGNLIRKSEEFGVDLEGITIHNNQIIVVDEMLRMFSKYDFEFSLITQKRVPYLGGRNKAFESITFNQVKNVFVTVTEKDPSTIYELDENFNVQAEFKFPYKVRDISGATYFNDKIWFLSDEDRMLRMANPSDYKVEKTFLLPIINPEGLTFDANGNLYICSDDMERLYKFNAENFK